MKQETLCLVTKVYELNWRKFGGPSEILRILVLTAEAGWITRICSYLRPDERIVPDVSSQSEEEAKFIGVRSAIYLQHEDDPDIAQKLQRYEGELKLRMRELAKEWKEIVI